MHTHDYSAVSAFLASIFGETTEQVVEIRALPNARGDGRAASLFSRDPSEIKAHCAIWDQPERAVYFGAATRVDGSRTGSRADLAELPTLWVDIDTAKLGLEKATVIDALRNMAMPPSAIVDSGGGIHAYWLLREALDVRIDASDVTETEEAVVDALKRLMGITAGDPAVCDLARIMRLPGTHNTKTGDMRLAHVVEATWARYEFDEVVEMLDWHRPVIARPSSAGGKAPIETDPYIEAAKRFGLKTPLDIEQRLTAMNYLGSGDDSIHQTQLHVSASLVTQGLGEDEIVEILLDATKRAAGMAGANWNWKREERNIRKLIESARVKFVPPPQAAQPANTDRTEDEVSNKANGTNGASGGARVIDLTEAREARGKKKPVGKEDKDPVISRVGNAVIAGWQESRGQIAIVRGDPYTYEGGIWSPWDKATHHALRTAIQAVVGAAKIDPKTQLLNAVYRYVLERPSLLREGVIWDNSGLIVCQDGAIDPITREVFSHSPDYWASSRVEVRIADMAQGCPKWLAFLETSFSNLLKPEADAVIATLGEWIGAALVKKKPRELRKALWLHGESRTGKTRIAEVLRLLIGEPICALKPRALEKNFGGSALIGKRAWIVDDAVGSSDEIDDALFKVIVTGEAFSTDVKNRDHETLRLDIPVLFTSNPLPRVNDQSDALYNRSLLAHMRVVRDEEETSDVKPIDEYVAEHELAGVFSWSLDGWARARARGRFSPPVSMNDAANEFKAANNVVGSWVKESMVIDSEYMIDRRDAYASFKGWYAAEYGVHAKTPSPKFMMNALRQCMTLGSDHKSMGIRYITCVKLTEEGLIYWDDSETALGASPGSGCKKSDVNKTRPFRAEIDTPNGPSEGSGEIGSRRF